MSERRSIVVGHQGQDGCLLASILQKRGDRVLGIDRGITEYPGEETPAAPLSILDPGGVAEAVRRFAPCEIYYLAAYHRSSQTVHPAGSPAADLKEGLGVNVEGVVHFLEAIRRHARQARLFHASSSLIFGRRAPGERQDEETVWTPACEYGLMKALAMQACRMYRDRYGIFACCGILYNHESVLRPAEFLSKKVVLGALRAWRGSKEKLVLGDLEAVTDWSYAPDFADAFTRILALEKPEDFILASGEGHTVREFVATAFAHVGLDWREYVIEDAGLLHRYQSVRIGNPHRLMDATGWRPSLQFGDMVRRLVDEAAAESMS